MPATVPWPPAKDISMAAPAAGDSPNTGPRMRSTASPPSANWPKEKVLPMMKCGADFSHTSLSGGTRLPIMIAPNTMLIRMPGSTRQTLMSPSGKRPPGCW